ncbi:MAG TPA: hypothetical protein VIR29_00870 [Anseongella sp.]
MKVFLKIVSFAGLLLTIMPSILVFCGSIEMQTHYLWTLAGTVLWFATAPFWMGRKNEVEG